MVRIISGEIFSALTVYPKQRSREQGGVENDQRKRVLRLRKISNPGSVNNETAQTQRQRDSVVGLEVGEHPVLEDGRGTGATQPDVARLAHDDHQVPRPLHHGQDVFLLARRERPPTAVRRVEVRLVVDGREVLVVVGEQVRRRHAVERKHLKVRQEAPGRDDGAGDEVGVYEQRQRGQSVGLDVARRHLHDVVLGQLVGQRGGGRELRDQVDAQTQDRAHGLRDAHEGPEQLRDNLWITDTTLAHDILLVC